MRSDRTFAPKMYPQNSTDVSKWYIEAQMCLDVTKCNSIIKGRKCPIKLPIKALTISRCLTHPSPPAPTPSPYQTLLLKCTLPYSCTLSRELRNIQPTHHDMFPVRWLLYFTPDPITGGYHKVGGTLHHCISIWYSLQGQGNSDTAVPCNKDMHTQRQVQSIRMQNAICIIMIITSIKLR